MTLVFFCGCLWPDAVQAFEVVVLHDQAQESGWSAGLSQGLQAEADTVFGANEVHFRHVFLGGPDLDEEHYETVFERLAGEGGSVPMGVVADGETAFGFARKYGADLYPGVPLVYCAMDRPDPAVLGDCDRCTGVPSMVDVKGTVDLIFALRPTTRLVVAVTDTSQRGALLRAATEQAMNPYLERAQLLFPGFEVGDDTELSLESLGDVLSSIPHDGVVLYLGYGQETDGEPVSVLQIVRLIEDRSVAPVFTVDSSVLLDEAANGLVVGGSVATAQATGRKVMQTLARVVRGEDSSEMLVEPASPEVVLDGVALRRFGMTALQGATVLRSVPQEGTGTGDTDSPWLFPAGIALALFAVFFAYKRLRS